MNNESSGESQSEWRARMQVLQNRLAPFVSEKPGLMPYLREAPDSWQSKRYQQIADLESSFSMTAQTLDQTGAMPEGDSEKMLATFEADLQRLETEPRQ